jgi:hypothetical protein
MDVGSSVEVLIVVCGYQIAEIVKKQPILVDPKKCKMPKRIYETYITKEWYYSAVLYKKVGMNNKGTTANRIIRCYMIGIEL